MLDRIGIALTSLCALHCILLPVLLPVLPLLGLSLLADHGFERIVLIITLILGFATLFAGFHRYHRQLYPFYALALGGVIYWHKDILGAEWEPLILSIGSVLVVAAHWLNLKLCNSCKGCHQTENQPSNCH